jgi:cell division septation protein DedD
MAAAITPQWLFLPSRGNPTPQSTAAPSSWSSVSTASLLQTGLFSQEENAKKMADRLAKAGFRYEISHRNVNGTDYWAVYVRPGYDINQTILELKNAGFESFLVK